MENDKYFVFDNMIEGVQVINRKWEYIYANESIARQGLTTRETMLSSTMLALYPEIEQTRVFQLLSKCMEDRIPNSTVTEFIFPDGSKGWFEVSIQPVPEGIIVLSSDITKQIKAEAQLKKKLSERTQMLSQITKQKKQLEEFCQIIAHNLRAPLSNLLLLSDLVKESVLVDEKLQYMEIQKPVVDFLHDTFEELIDATQVRMDHTIKRYNINLQRRTKAVIKTLQYEIEKSKAIITYDFSKAKTIFYSKKYIDSILTNLLSNAIKFKSEDRKPEIHIRSYKKEGWIYIEVKDNCIGIDLKKNKENLFKLHKTFHNHPNAKGFGLFITKTQIETMGGSITARSIVNQGSIFTAKLTKKEAL